MDHRAILGLAGVWIVFSILFLLAAIVSVLVFNISMLVDSFDEKYKGEEYHKILPIITLAGLPAGAIPVVGPTILLGTNLCGFINACLTLEEIYGKKTKQWSELTEKSAIVYVAFSGFTYALKILGFFMGGMAALIATLGM